jgi:tetratricopeptide (TPR) repeat protein
MLNRGAEALAMMERARSVAPDDVIILTNLANQLADVGRLDDAFVTVEHAMQIDSTNPNLLGLHVHLLFRAGREAEARTRLASLEKRPEFSRFRLATLYENTRDIDRIITLLEESAARHEDELGQIRMPGMFPGARNDPRFVKLLQSME